MSTTPDSTTVADKLSELPGPVMSEAAILAMYPPKGIDEQLLSVPQDSLYPHVFRLTGAKPQYELQRARIEGTVFWRATTTIRDPKGSGMIVGIGDHATSARKAKSLAALSALLQLNLTDQTKCEEPHPPPPTMSDGTILTIDRAKSFMDWYCAKYGYEPSHIEIRRRSGRVHSRHGTASSHAIVTVDGARIGNATRSTSELAKDACYLDAVAYLDRMDPHIWSAYLGGVPLLPEDP